MLLASVGVVEGTASNPSPLNSRPLVSTPMQSQLAEQEGSSPPTLDMLQPSVHAMALSGQVKHKDYGQFHKELDDGSREVLAHATAGGVFSFSSMSKWKPVQEMFYQIGQGSDLIERTKDFRKRMQKGKPLLTEAEANRAIETPIDAYVKILGLGHHGIHDMLTTGKVNINAAKLEETTAPDTAGKSPFENQKLPVGQKKEDPLSIKSILSTLQRNGDWDSDDEDSDDLFSHLRHHRRTSHDDDNDDEDDDDDKYSRSHTHHSSRSRHHHHVREGKGQKRGDDMFDTDRIPVYNFLQLSEKLRPGRPAGKADLSSMIVLGPPALPEPSAERAQQKLIFSPPAVGTTSNIGVSAASGAGVTTGAGAATGTGVTAGYDKSASDVAGSAINSIRSTIANIPGQALAVPLLVAALSSSAAGGSPNVDTTTSPDPFSKMSPAMAPDADHCYSMEEHWINECSMPPSSYLAKEVVETPISPESRASLMLRGNIGSRPSAPSSRTNIELPRELASNVNIQRLLQRIGANAVVSSEEQSGTRPMVPMSPATPQITGSLIRLLKTMFGGVQEAVSETVTPGDDEVAAAYTTGGLSGMVGMVKGLGAMWPVMGMGNPTTSSQMVRSPDYYGATTPDALVQGEFNISPAEKCDRLLHSWLFKCAVNPM